MFRIDVHDTNSGRSGEKGTRLGLTLCKELIEKNDGHIWIESEVNNGTALKFSLPIPKDNDEDERLWKRLEVSTEPYEPPKPSPKAPRFNWRAFPKSTQSFCWLARPQDKF